MALLLLTQTGCLPAPLTTPVAPETQPAQHRLDKAFGTYEDWTENGVELDTYSCHTPRNFFPESHRYAHATYLHAMMANNAYDNPPDKPTFEIPGWTLARRYETRNDYVAHLYLSQDRTQGVVAYRGTDSLEDWLGSNLTLMPIPPQYVEAQRTLDLVRREFPETAFSVAGHSLGGGLALSVSLNTEGVDAYVFNTSPRVTTWRGPYENDVYVATEKGEVLRAFSRPLIPLGLPSANRRDFQFAKAASSRGPLPASAINHGIYTLARSLLLLAAQDKQASSSSEQVPGLEHARASFAANIDRAAALALNPRLCAPFFPAE